MKGENKDPLVSILWDQRVRRASVVCVSRQRSAADPPWSNCPMIQEENQVNRVLRGHLDLQDSGLMVNRECQD